MYAVTEAARDINTRKISLSDVASTWPQTYNRAHQSLEISAPPDPMRDVGGLSLR